MTACTRVVAGGDGDGYGSSVGMRQGKVELD